MLQSAKRNAEQAFEEGDTTGVKSQKKQKRSRKRRNSDIQQPQTVNTYENEAEVALQDTAETLQVSISHPHARSSEAQPTLPSKKKRKQRHSGLDSEGGEPTDTQDGGRVLSADAEKVEQGHKHKKKRKKPPRSKQGGEEGGEVRSIAECAPETQQQATNGRTEPTESNTGPDVGELLQKEKHKRWRKPRRQSNEAGGNETTVAEPPTIEPDIQSSISLENGTEKPKSKKKRRKAKQKGSLVAFQDQEALTETNEPNATIPLEARIEPPPVRADGSFEVLQDGVEDDQSDSGADQGVDITGLVPLEDRIEAPLKKSKSRKRSSKPKSGSQFDRESAWSVSAGAGGIFIAHDPLLTSDDEHLILPARSDVQVYSRSTSLLIRKLQPHMKVDDQIVSCVQSSSEPSHLLVATSSGSVSLWAWTSGEEISRWEPMDLLEQIISTPTKSSSNLILAVHRHRGGRERTLSLRSLDRSLRRQVTVLDLLKRHDLDANVQFFEQAGVIVANAGSNLLLGYAPDWRPDQESQVPFSWRELKVPSRIVSFDTKIGDATRHGSTPRVDVAAGLQSGEVMLYEDLLYKLIGKEKEIKTVDISARVLHWHRNAVTTVKWSRDNNYLISGGRETVLVIWQLDTNRQQHLPHLSSEILNLTVSPKGSSYALRLADNSVMVLSSANLDVTTNVSGFAAHHDLHTQVAASLHPTSLDQLLIAVPRDTFNIGQSAFALQTYDLSTDRELRRQALTRNSTTVVKTESNGSSKVEPNVTHLRLSTDGKWLATVEEWRSDPRDLDGVTLLGEDDIMELGAETCLKIWLYNEQHGDWECVNRIDNPHSRGSTKIFALESSPSRNEFASAGSDGMVRIWRPRARVRDGVPVQNQAGEQLYNWSQMTFVSCPGADSANTEGRINSAALAYSPDGTVIAASWPPTNSSPRWTYFLDCEQGRICSTIPDLATEGCCSLAFSDRYLVTLSNTLCIYDTVTGSTMSKTELGPKYQSPSSHRHVAVNALDGTVAMAVNPKDGTTSAHLAIIDVKALDKSPLFEQEISGQVKALLSSPVMHGFVLIDGNARIRRIRRTRGQVEPSGINALGAGKESEDVRKGLDRIFGQAQREQTAGDGPAAGRLLTNGEHHTAGKTLEEILNFQTSAQAPPVGELFNRVASLFASPATVA